MSGGLATEEIGAEFRHLDRAVAWLNNRRMFALVILFSAIVYAQYNPLTQPVRRDRANWDY
ncbi:MAG TPA: hypothetical protein VFQ92_05595, partial [Blastocatellia bacterium]|nr:hypothetical protein [Blastocatellia bacterium]